MKTTAEQRAEIRADARHLIRDLLDDFTELEHERDEAREMLKIISDPLPRQAFRGDMKWLTELMEKARAWLDRNGR